MKGSSAKVDPAATLDAPSVPESLANRRNSFLPLEARAADEKLREKQGDDKPTIGARLAYYVDGIVSTKRGQSSLLLTSMTVFTVIAGVAYAQVNEVPDLDEV
jgi:hypothetical protein